MRVGKVVGRDWVVGVVMGWYGSVHNIYMLHVIANIGRLHLSACVRCIFGTEDLWEFLLSYLH